MAVRAVVLDLDGTLVGPDGARLPGVTEMIAMLGESEIHIAVASDRPAASTKLGRAGIVPDLLLTRQLVLAPKGSPSWVDHALTTFQVRRHQLVWLGNSDTDMRSAVNGKVVYLNAGWSDPSYRYGITVATPELFALVIRECFGKSADWYWQFSSADSRGRVVEVRSMTDARGAGRPALRRALLRLLKDGQGGSAAVGPLTLERFVTLHLLGSIYSSGLAQTAETWTVYPGSGGGINATLGPFTAEAARLFRGERYVEDLLVRHTPAIDMSEARVRGEDVNFEIQVNSVCLNQAHRGRIERQHVLVVDDFEKDGYSFECARNLLLQAGADRVTCVAVGKYGDPTETGLWRSVFAPTPGYTWNPYAAVTHPEGSFIGWRRSSQPDRAALE